jgi:phosphate transport system substrate-binding protein
MMTASGTCTNYGACSIANSGKPVELYPGPGEYCPECGEKLAQRLEPVVPATIEVPLREAPLPRRDEVKPKPRRGSGRPRFIAAGAAAFVVLVAGAVAFRLYSTGGPSANLTVCGYGTSTSGLALKLTRGFLRSAGAESVNVVAQDATRTTLSAVIPRAGATHADVVTLDGENTSLDPNGDGCRIRIVPAESWRKAVALAGLRPSDAQATEIARDGVVVVVNPANPIEQLDVHQLQGIFAGSISSWNVLGGSNAPITVIAADENSEEFTVLRDELLKNNLPIGANISHPASSVAQTVAAASSRDAIGITLFSSAEPARIVKIIADDGSSIVPSRAGITQRTYPLLLHVFLIAETRSDPLVSEFISFVNSRSGRDVVVRSGFVPSSSN